MYLIRKGEKPRPVCREHGKVIRRGKLCPECRRLAKWQREMEERFKNAG